MNSSDTLIGKIEDHISQNGGNRHKYPITIGKHDGKWSVVLEIDSATRTLDVETEHHSLPTALAMALAALKRQYSIIRRRAA